MKLIALTLLCLLAMTLHALRLNDHQKDDCYTTCTVVHNHPP